MSLRTVNITKFEDWRIGRNNGSAQKHFLKSCPLESANSKSNDIHWFLYVSVVTICSHFSKLYTTCKYYLYGYVCFHHFIVLYT